MLGHILRSSGGAEQPLPLDTYSAHVQQTSIVRILSLVHMQHMNAYTCTYVYMHITNYMRNLYSM